MRTRPLLLTILAAAGMSWASVPSATAQVGTEVTYQGRLTDGGKVLCLLHRAR